MNGFLASRLAGARRDFRGAKVDNLPPYLVSAGLHLLVLIAVALPFVARHTEPSVVLLEALPTAASQVATEIVLEAPSSRVATGDASVAARDVTVGSALEWLAEVQQPSGGWSRSPGNGDWLAEREDVESTAFALLAFASVGQTHKSGKYANVVRRGMQFLVDQGELTAGSPPTGLRFASRKNQPRTQALATLTIGTHYSMTNDKQLGKALQLAVTELCAAQVPNVESA